MTGRTRKIAVAMSGGVDSSVAAALLVEQGEDAFGIMLRLWSAGADHQNRCCTPADVARAREIAGQLGLPFYTLDVKDQFKSSVVNPFIRGYAQGLTPNPCVSCNRSIRFGFLLDRALAMGATHLATGHYARINNADNHVQLLRGVDRTKDQSYVLSVLTQRQLQHALFPLGELTKLKVREIAVRHQLASAERPDSQDLCFLGQQDYRTFLVDQGSGGLLAGSITDQEGHELGQHAGLARYTIGQRKGIGISGPQPLYVLEKRMTSNTLVVGTRDELGRTDFSVANVNWLLGHPPAPHQTLRVQVRYRAPEAACRLSLRDAETVVHLQRPLPDITPGQQAVFYSGDYCLGGGMIEP